MNCLFISLYIFSVSWPLAPQDSTHAIGNNYGQFQELYGYIYLHDAIDVMADSGGRPVYAVADGYVKNWFSSGGIWYYGLAIGDEYGTDSCDGYYYWHLDSTMFHLNAGDTCQEGDLIGHVVPWFGTGQPVFFHHTHLCRIRSADQWYYAQFVQNPLAILSPNTDTMPPEFEDALGLDRFAFCRNNTSEYLDPDSLTGDVDIIAHINDQTGDTTAWPEWNRLIPYKIEYRMHGPDTIPVTRFMEFSGLLYSSQYAALTIYKNDATCNSRADFEFRDFYFIITNTDGDSLIEVSDTAGCWQTEQYEDGTYWVVVTAYDIYGNATSDSMQVTLQNYVGICEIETAGIERLWRVRPTVISRYGDLVLSYSNDKTVLSSYGLYNCVGQCISSGTLSADNSSAISIPLAQFELSAGIYFFFMHNGEDRVMEKIVIIE